MVSSITSPGLIHILVLAFVTGACSSIGIHALAAHHRPPHRTSHPTPTDTQLPSSHSINHQLDGSLESNVKLRRRLVDRVHSVLNGKTLKESPSKRFNQYLTMTRDFFPIRRSYVQPTRREVARDSNLVPVIDHFAGVKTLSVPYHHVAVEPSTVGAVLNREQNDSPAIQITKPTPTEKAPTLKQSEKEQIFDDEYLANSNIDQFAPYVNVPQQGFGDEPILDGIELLKHNLQKLPTGFDNTQIPGSFIHFPDSKYNGRAMPNARRTGFDDFGIYKALSPGEQGDFDPMLAFSQEQHFGKHLPKHFSSGGSSDSMGFSSFEQGWGAAKNRDLLNSGFMDGAILDSDAFRSVGTFGNSEEQKDCHNIETKTCSTDVDCSCMNLYKCVAGVCKDRISIHTTTDSRQDSNNNNEYWITGPAIKNE